MNMKRVVCFALLLGATVLVGCGEEKEEKQKESEVLAREKSVEIKYGFPIDDYRVVEDTVKRHETLSDILSKYNVSSQKVHDLVVNTRNVFSPRKFRPEHKYSLLFCSLDSNALPSYFIYERSKTSYVVYDLRGDVKVKIEEHPKEVRYKVYGNTINTSLWESMVENEVSPALAMSLAEVYQWTVDFYGIQKGDSYKVLYAEDYVEDKPVGNIRPVASIFVHRGVSSYAFRFEHSDVKGYFDENGVSLHKAFLKNPLKYSRISSRFSTSRFHPITGRHRPHNGVDYAAPTGTPILCVGDGVVIKKAYQRRGAGRYLKIKHNKTYTTLYMHMSRFASDVRVGDRVSQGQLIGYVGMTGLATGPHLHYSVMKNGKYIDPLKMQSPPKKPLSGDVLQAFKNKKDSLLYKLKQI